MRFLFFFAVGLFTLSCEPELQPKTKTSMDWSSKTVENLNTDSLKIGKTYLSVYSQIYSRSEHRVHDLTSTISLRNISEKDSVYILKADYYNTNGEFLRSYLHKSIALSPLETIEIIIEEIDNEGGTGANFIFQWAVKKGCPDPFFEGVMISTSGQQGLSFTTQGIKLE